MSDRPSAQPPADASDPSEPRRAETDPAGSSPWYEFPLMILGALVLAILLKTFIVQAFFIPSTSMTPTLLQGDRIIVCRACLWIDDVDRGDVIVFSGPTHGAAEGRGAVAGALHWIGEGIGVAHPANEDFIKRVIALPGDTWEMRDGVVYVDGVAVDEPYLELPTDTSAYGPETVPDGMLFVLGDNRLDSGDSRFEPPTGVGYVAIDDVIGKAFVKIWPPSRIGWIR